jgi:hypothetical protein
MRCISSSQEVDAARIIRCFKWLSALQSAPYCNKQIPGVDPAAASPQMGTAYRVRSEFSLLHCDFFTAAAAPLVHCRGGQAGSASKQGAGSNTQSSS